MTKYSVRGSAVFLSNTLDNYTPLDLLPTATYAVALDMKMGFFLTQVPDFTLPKKLYGNTESISNRVLDTFDDREGTTGVLLQGLKGSGKSLAMKQISVAALKKNIPTIIVGSAYSGEGFNKFIQSIDQPAILVFDEFEKVYSREQQNELLTLFDGIFSSKKLFLLTVNDKYSVSEYMKNRPGRIFYNIEYDGLDSAFIREYCEDRLEDKSKIETILAYSGMFRDFNFDMLQALVEELNRYDESVKDALKLLNIAFEGDTPRYNVTYFTTDGKQIDPKFCGPHVIKDIFNKETYAFLVKRPEAKDATFDGADEWLEEYLHDWKDDQDTLTFTIAMTGDHVEKEPDMSQIRIHHDNGVVVFTRATVKAPAYYGYF